jgi:hypothetical protein
VQSGVACADAAVLPSWLQSLEQTDAATSRLLSKWRSAGSNFPLLGPAPFPRRSTDLNCSISLSFSAQSMAISASRSTASRTRFEIPNTGLTCNHGQHRRGIQEKTRQSRRAYPQPGAPGTPDRFAPDWNSVALRPPVRKPMHWATPAFMVSSSRCARFACT